MIENALKIKGWMTHSELEWLARTAQRYRIIAEVGCYKGRSTRALADNCEGTVIAIDPWHESYHKDNGEVAFSIGDRIFAEFCANVFNQPTKSKVFIIKGTFKEASEQLVSLDFVFIDGDHRYEFVKEDIEIAKKLVRPGGIIAGHDYIHADWPGVKKAVDESFSNINLCDSIWWITRTGE